MNEVPMTQLFSQSFFPMERRGSYLAGFGQNDYANYSGLYKKVPGFFRNDFFPAEINYSPEVNNTRNVNNIPGTLPGVKFTLQTPRSKVTRVKFGKSKKLKKGVKMAFERK